MDSSDHLHSPGNSPETTNPRLLLVHRLPRFATLFLSKLQTRYRILDPLNESSDPSFHPLSNSVRVMLCVGPTPVTSETLDKYPSLECIVGTSAGSDHFDLAECRRRGVRVTSAGESFSDDVADFAVGLLIDVLRRVSVAHRFVRAGSWPVKGEFPLGSKVGGKRVGIVGLGSIGSRVSKRLEAFGCRISYTSKTMKPNVSFPFHSNIHYLAINSDVLILCCALTKETHHFIDKEVLTALGKEGIVINVGRGALIDEKVLVEFLKRGEIGGAGLDVYENEPNVPEELFGLDNVVLSPHTAVVTPESFQALEELFTCNIEAFFSNKPLRAQIEFE